MMHPIGNVVSRANNIGFKILFQYTKKQSMNRPAMNDSAGNKHSDLKINRIFSSSFFPFLRFCCCCRRRRFEYLNNNITYKILRYS